MSKISELKTILSQQLSWHKSRIDFFARLLFSLLICRTINLQKLAVTMESEANIDSRNRRIRRFLANYKLNYDDIAKWLFNLFFSNVTSVYIAIDRTNWYFGKSKINVFMLSVCYEGIAIPIYWKLLNKAGSSTGEEQIQLVNRFVANFGTKQIKALLADREFPNKKFITWLEEKRIPFYMRIKHDTLIKYGKITSRTCGQLFSTVQPYENRVFEMSLPLFGCQLFVTASRNERGELMIVATNSDPKIAIATYLRRWEVESLFQALKKRGFNFEDTHVTELERIEKLVFVMAIALGWAHKVGEWHSKAKPILLKKKINQKRPQYSYFRYGLDYITDKITNFKQKTHEIRKIIEFIIPSYSLAMEVT